MLKLRLKRNVQIPNRNSYILGIGIDKYSDVSFPNLNNAKIDVQRIIKILTENYGFETIEEPLFDDTANRKNIIETLNQLAYKVTSEDNLIIYYTRSELIWENFLYFN